MTYMNMYIYIYKCNYILNTEENVIWLVKLNVRYRQDQERLYKKGFIFRSTLRYFVQFHSVRLPQNYCWNVMIHYNCSVLTVQTDNHIFCLQYWFIFMNYRRNDTNTCIRMNERCYRMLYWKVLQNVILKGVTECCIERCYRMLYWKFLSKILINYLEIF